MLLVSVGREFRSGPVRMPRLRSKMSGPHLEGLKTQCDSTTGGWNHLEAHSCVWWPVLAVGWDLSWDSWPEYQYVASSYSFGFLTIWWLASCARQPGESHAAFYDTAFWVV